MYWRSAQAHQAVLLEISARLSAHCGDKICDNQSGIRLSSLEIGAWSPALTYPDTHWSHQRLNDLVKIIEK